mmetsp:Transcript_9891/g.15997  ORF Transcript_9891/g.15997 Transcript_9891/m.15997 type:complete len:355 (-) Transcript_9891:308-1372(-)
MNIRCALAYSDCSTPNSFAVLIAASSSRASHLAAALAMRCFADCRFSTLSLCATALAYTMGPSGNIQFSTMSKPFSFTLSRTAWISFASSYTSQFFKARRNGVCFTIFSHFCSIVVMRLSFTLSIPRFASKRMAGTSKDVLIISSNRASSSNTSSISCAFIFMAFSSCSSAAVNNDAPSGKSHNSGVSSPTARALSRIPSMRCGSVYSFACSRDFMMFCCCLSFPSRSSSFSIISCWIPFSCALVKAWWMLSTSVEVICSSSNFTCSVRKASFSLALRSNSSNIAAAASYASGPSGTSHLSFWSNSSFFALSRTDLISSALSFSTQPCNARHCGNCSLILSIRKLSASTRGPSM